MRLFGELRHRRRVRAAVVVEDDDHVAVAVAEVVQRLVGHAAGQRAVADDRDDVAPGRVGPAVAGDGEAVGVREDRRGVAVLHEVVLRLLAGRVAGQPAGLAQLLEARRPVRSRSCGRRPGGPVSQRMASRGESNTRCSASVSSTAPRLEPRWPLFSATAATMKSRISPASSSSSWGSRSRRSAGERMVSSSMTDRRYRWSGGPTTSALDRPACRLPGSGDARSTRRGRGR